MTTHLGPTRPHAAGEGERAALGTLVGGRADGKRRSLGERDFVALFDGTHQFLEAPTSDNAVRSAGWQETLMQ
ncbi:hypothetical protein [Streptomyces griseus]|uniref:hypothetical protein n=1 Tax=Streptomyces griseus TaxID=1911 RepID=UPI00055A7189|nr:hypothetical protein [Streptomyces griseus]